MNELSTNLGTVFLMRLACGNLAEVVLPILKVHIHTTLIISDNTGRARTGYPNSPLCIAVFKCFDIL